MNRDDILKLAHEACIVSPENTGEVWCAGEWQLVEFAELIAAAEHKAVFDTIEELMGSEAATNVMFGEGYDYALEHIKQFVEGRGKEHEQR